MYLGWVVGCHQVEGGLLSGPSREDGISPILDEERGGEGVPSKDGQMEQAVPLLIQHVQVAAVTDQGAGDALMAMEEGQVQGDVPLVITFIKLTGKLGSGACKMMSHTH